MFLCLFLLYIDSEKTFEFNDHFLVRYLLPNIYLKKTLFAVRRENSFSGGGGGHYRGGGRGGQGGHDSDRQGGYADRQGGYNDRRGGYDDRRGGHNDGRRGGHGGYEGRERGGYEGGGGGGRGDRHYSGGQGRGGHQQPPRSRDEERGFKAPYNPPPAKVSIIIVFCFWVMGVGCWEKEEERMCKGKNEKGGREKGENKKKSW